MFQLPPLRVGDPIHQGRVTVFPLLAVAEAIAPDYILADEALATKKLTVTEISEEGSVPEFSVHNELDQTVLFLEGEALQGAKQHRIFNTSVLVEAGKDMRIPS